MPEKKSRARKKKLRQRKKVTPTKKKSRQQKKSRAKGKKVIVIKKKQYIPDMKLCARVYGTNRAPYKSGRETRTFRFSVSEELI